MKPIKTYQTTLISSVGSALEYYGYITYIMLAPYLSKLFFPNANPNAALLHTLLVYAAGSLMTTIGGISFAWLGDRIGRKKLFLLSIMLMAFSNIAIALLPTQLGFVGTVALVSLRLLQGLAQGAELPGAITFVVEHAKPHERGKQCGLLFLGVGLGASLSTLVNMILTRLLTESQILAFGWRIPFLLAGLLAVVGYWLRHYTEETPAFQQQTQFHKMPLLHLLNQAPQRWFQGVGIMIFAACLVTFGLYLPVYLTQYCHYDSSHIYSAMSLSFLLSAFCLPVFGMLSDKIGRQRMLLMAISITLLLLILSLPSLGKHQFNVMAFMLLYYIAITSMAACYPVMLAELFNTTSRYSGVASCYTTAYACSAFIPALFTALLLHMSAVHLIWVFIILASISLIATSYYQGHQAKAFY